MNPIHRIPNKKIRLRQVVPLGFGAVLVLMVGVGFFSKLSVTTLIETIQLVNRSYAIKEDLDDLERLLLNAETGQRGFIFTNREEFLEPYNSAVREIDTSINELRAELRNDPIQIQTLNEIEALTRAKLDELAQTIVLRRTGREQELRNLVLSERGKNIMDDIRTNLTSMRSFEEERLQARQARADEIQRFAALLVLSGTFVAVLIGASIAIFIARKIVQPLNQVAGAIATSSTEIAAAIEQQERNVTQQAAAVSQTTTTMDELSASSQQSANQAESAAASAQEVLFLVDGNHHLGWQSMADEASLREKVGQIAEQILRLSEQTHQIGSISNLVSDLASQTNMLALNAAVEAARAGEHGRGFAVVAGEIRKLADQSRKSAERINALVADVQNATNSTVMVTDEGTKTVEKIVDAINNIALNNQQISVNSKQQAIAIAQVVEAMNVLNETACQTTSGIRQIRVGTQQLNEAALDLREVV